MSLTVTKKIVDTFNKDLGKINIFLFVKPTIAINFPAFILFKHVICINQPFAAIKVKFSALTSERLKEILANPKQNYLLY